MKSVVIFIESLYCGGAERSLISLLNNIERSNLSIKVLVSKRGGEFEKELPEDIGLENITFYPTFISRLKFKIARIFNFFYKKHNAQLFWKATKKNIPVFHGHYDIAIAWGQGFATYFVSEKINATKKYAWVNTDYEKAGYVFRLDYDKYNRFDKIVCISDFVGQIMKRRFDENRVITIKNIVDRTEILSRTKDTVSMHFDKTQCNILSVGRLEIYKGFELAVLAAGILLKRGCNFHWYIIGNGSEKDTISRLIIKNELQPYITLMGQINNPYPYMNECDIYVQTSRFEGMGRTLIEAGILNKPIITTNFPTASYLFEDKITALIVEMNPEAIANATELLINDQIIRENLTNNLMNKGDNEKEVTLNKVYCLLNC